MAAGSRDTSAAILFSAAIRASLRAEKTHFGFGLATYRAPPASVERQSPGLFLRNDSDLDIRQALPEIHGVGISLRNPHIANAREDVSRAELVGPGGIQIQPSPIDQGLGPRPPFERTFAARLRGVGEPPYDARW